MDYIFINGQQYLLTKSAKINLHYIQAWKSRGKVDLKKGLDIVKQTYKSRGSNITQYHGDNESEKIGPHLIPSTLHICAADEHIGGIDRASSTVKERVWRSFHSTPYKIFTKLMNKAVIQYAIYWLNTPPLR